jgi:hypothetical protein
VLEYLEPSPSADPVESAIERIRERDKYHRRAVYLSALNRAAILSEVIQAFATKDIYQRDNRLVVIRHDSPAPKYLRRPPNAPSICVLPVSKIETEIDSSLLFVKQNKKQAAKTAVPSWLGRAVAECGDYPGVLPLETVTSVPFVLPPGDTFTGPGYQFGYGIHYSPTRDYPDFMGVLDALDLLDDVLCDFPFASAAHRAAIFAAILTLVGRYVYPGPTPFFLLDASRSGTGKTLACDLVSIIGTGTKFARMNEPENEAEWRKRLTSLFMCGERAVLLDNLSGTLRSDTLNGALTGERTQDRLLGTNTNVTARNGTVFFGSANNLTLNFELSRRTVYIRLESPLERPDKRTGFRHDPLLDYVQERQPELTMAANSLLHHYINAGMPDEGARLNSFDGWARVIANCCIWAGLGNPIEATEKLTAASDTDSNLLALLMDAWIEAVGNKSMSVAEAIERSVECPTLRAAFDEIQTHKNYDLKQAIGHTLKQLEAQVNAGRRFVGVEGRIKKWRVVTQ